MKILYSSGELNAAINKVLADPQSGDRRVVLVAFVGGQAQAFLPDPQGIEIVCWLQPGSTDSLTLDRLRKRHAKVYKSERLHMKVYWSSRRGCVICSANASGHGLGGGSHKEAGVFLPPGAVDIERLWAYAKPKQIKNSDLKRLTRESERAPRQNRVRRDEVAPDFIEWQNFSGRREWKLGWWTEDAAFAKSAVKTARQRFGVEEPDNMLNIRRGQLKQYEWALTFKLPGGTNLRWMYIDFIVKVDASDRLAFDRDNPFRRKLRTQAN